jgi:CBS domain containing-hemolysin-like protein
MAAVLGFLVVGTLFATADAAVTSLPEARLHAMVGTEENRSALKRYAEKRQDVLARLLVGRVICLVAAAVLATRFLTLQWAFASVAFAYTVLAEIATSFARARANTLANPLLQIVRPFELAMIPVAAPLAFLGQRISDALGKAPRSSDPEDAARNAEIAEKEVEYLIEEGQRTGTLDHADLLQAAVEFKGRVAGEVMVPRTKISGIELHTPLQRVLELITAEGHSRYPVFEGRIDDMVGLLYVKDLFRVVREGSLEKTTLEALVRKPVLFVQEQQEVSDILRDMRHRRLHMAVVVDEHGGTSGLVTLEDILELLVGDIRDELDDEEQVQDLGGGRLLVDAALSVETLSNRLGIVFPETSGGVAVGGLVLEQLGKVPITGTVVTIGNVDLVVRDADERRVRRIEVVARPERAAS